MTGGRQKKTAGCKLKTLMNTKSLLFYTLIQQLYDNLRILRNYHNRDFELF